MGTEMRLLTALVALLCIYTPGISSMCGAEECSSFRHLENGRTFFRYGGLLVIFRCHPGYKLHGYKTNSCVSGHWSRDPPVCVGSGCALPHGMSRMNENGSWAVFSCNSGFRLHGPSVLYCKGHTWNSTKPVCKESDMMSSVSGVVVQKPNIHQNLQAAVVLKTQQQSHYDILANAASKEANLKFGLLSHTPSQSNSEIIKVTNPKVHLQQYLQLPNFKVKNGVQTIHCEARRQEANRDQRPETGTGRHGSEAKASDEMSEKVEEVTQMFASKSNLSERPTSLPPSFSTARTPAITAVTNTAVKHSLPAVIRFGEPVTYWDYVTPSEVESGSLQTANENQEAVTDFQYLSLPQPDSVDKQEPTQTLSPSVYSISTSSSTTSSPALFFSTPLVFWSASTSSSPSSTTQSSLKTQVPNITLPSNTSTTFSGVRSHWSERHNLTMNATLKPPLLSLSLSRRPVCPYPPVPAHGTFYFRNVENPGPTVYRHYIQYACYPGYTLAHGDTHSYCQQGGTWSGITPVCLELTPCSVNNGGCSQLCSHSQYYNQSSNQTQTRTQCHCRPGFTLLDDGQTCRDLDECVEGQNPCQQRCINTFGSFKCGCDDGYHLAHDQTSCPDINECQEERCEWQCVNLPGSYHCICPRGYTLHRDGQRCKDINECSRKNGGCSHLCVNQKGGFKCACPDSHRLSHYSWKKCLPRTTANTAS